MHCFFTKCRSTPSRPPLKAGGEHGAHAVHRAQQEHEDIELLRVEVQGGQLEVKVPQAEQQRHAQIDERPREGVANGLAGLPLPLGTLGLGGVPALKPPKALGSKPPKSNENGIKTQFLLFQMGRIETHDTGKV